jgi:hypothetical protein
MQQQHPYKFLPSSRQERSGEWRVETCKIKGATGEWRVETCKIKGATGEWRVEPISHFSV